MSRISSLLLAACLVITATTATVAAASGPKPPRAEQRPFTVISPFGKREDPWYWLRDDKRTDKDMLAYLEAENAYMAAVMAPQRAAQEKLYNEIIGRLKQDDSSVPQRKNGYWYYARYETGKQYPIYARRQGSMEAAEEIIVDGNVSSTGHAFYQIANTEVSPDGRWIAIAEDTVGRRQYSIRIKDMQSGQYLPTTITNAEASLAWGNDNATLFYIRKDPQTLLGNQVYRHQRGTATDADRLVYTQEDESFYMGLGKSKSDRFIYIVSQSTVSSEYRYADANDPQFSFKVALPRERDHEYQLEDLGDRFIIRSNWKARNFRIVEAPIATVQDRSSWRDVIAHRDDAFIDSFEAFDGFLAVSERSGGLQKLRIRSWDGARNFLMDAADAAYTMDIGNNTEQQSPLLRYVYTSPTTPSTTYDYDVRTGQRTLLKQEPVLGSFDSRNYVAEFRFVPARDGAQVPVTLLYRKGTRLDGTAPMYQYAYGSYGYSTDPVFRSTVLSLVDRGFVYAIAHIRGGQEMGRLWYEQGRLQNKLNSFNDFIDVTRHLVKEKIADPARVFAMGGSAGGLLMGGIVNMAPELYKGIVAHVPFVDVMTTMLDESIPLTTNEFDEWGNPASNKATHDYMLSYSPYDQIKAQRYPAMLVTSGLWDSQVQYWEPTKWVARLRTVKTDDNPLLLRTNMEAGHGGKSGRFERYQEVAEEYAFVLWQAGVQP
ncbi:MAG: S9 family peptidase [Gammaproteobacteria bacterium]|nr:S9 family peptidase [Gammaproteobacteria bacterium]